MKFILMAFNDFSVRLPIPHISLNGDISVGDLANADLKR